jgi:hypothetical protein
LQIYFFKLSLSYKALLCLEPSLHKYRSHRPFHSPVPYSAFNPQRTGSSKSPLLFLSLPLYFHFTTTRLCLFTPPSIFEMFSKSLIVSVFLLTLTSSVNVQAAPAPALGIRGNLGRDDIQPPSNRNPCGHANITKDIGTPTPVVAGANGTSSLITRLNR